MEHNLPYTPNRKASFAAAAGGFVGNALPVSNTCLAWLGGLVRDVTAAVHACAVPHDPALTPLRTQVLTHLRHIGFSFRTKGEGYPHAPVLAGQYPAAPSARALVKAKNFLEWVRGCGHPIAPHFPDLADTDELKRRHKDLIASITSDPWRYYVDARRRLTESGEAALFPEYADTVDFLLVRLRDAGVTQSPLLRRFRDAAANKLLAARRGGFSYRETIDAIEYGVEFFDVLCRSNDPEHCPPLYHSHRYEYYLHYLAARIPDHVFFPTIADLGVTDLLKVRGVPVGFIGVAADTCRVDGFVQTPYEFFMHDVNHARRMEQFAREECARRGIDDMAFYAQTNAYVRDVLLPCITPRKMDSPAERALKKTVKMVLFEVLHEDALPADPEVIRAALLRPPSHMTPFEGIEGDDVVYVMEPGATTLAYVYRKLAHTFYDAPEDRRDYIVNDVARSRENIVRAAETIFSALNLSPPTRAQLQFLASTDEGFPDDFRQDLERDIATRGLQGLNA